MNEIQTDEILIFHKPTFDRIASEKRQRILDVAIKEFASQGYNATSINEVARACGISIGSMYSYFESKENLFMTIVEYSRSVLISALKEIQLFDGSAREKLVKTIEVLQVWPEEYKELNQIYIDISTQGLKHLSTRLSNRMESFTATVYQEIFEQGKNEGIIDSSIDDGIAAFCLDNIFTMLQFSYTSSFYRERMKVYVGADIFEDPERVVCGIFNFINHGLSSKWDS